MTNVIFYYSFYSSTVSTMVFPYFVSSFYDSTIER